MEFEKIKSIILGQIKGLDESDITLGSSFVEDLGADSLDLIDMLTDFEQQFGIEITDEEAENIETVEDAVELIRKKI